MKINWRVRFSNPRFCFSIISAVLLLIQAITAVFGLTLDFGELGNRLKVVVEALFVVLALLGVVNDPTTAGMSDSKQALTYDRPKED